MRGFGVMTGVNVRRFARAAGRRAIRRITMAGMTVAMLSSGASAGAYRLVEGYPYTVCRDVERNLHAFPDAGTMKSEWPVDPTIESLRKPHWKPLDPALNLEIIKQIEIHIADRFDQRDDAADEAWWQKKRPAFMKLVEDDAISLQTSRFDINNDGQAERVYRLRTHPEGVTDAMALRWIYDITDRANPIYRSYRPWVGHLYVSDVILHEGRTYFVGISEVEEELFVFEPLTVRHVNDVSGDYSQYAIKTVCTLKYRN